MNARNNCRRREGRRVNESLHNEFAFSQSYQNLPYEQKKRLGIFFDEIVGQTSIEFQNAEIVELKAAVYDMVEKVKDRINRRGIFNIDHIQSCGSMPEKTAIWKWDAASGKLYTEFDFLAVLKPSSEGIAENKCCGCLRLTNPPIDIQKFRQKYSESYSSLYSCINDIRAINNLFIQEIVQSLTSACSCLLPKFMDTSNDGLYRQFTIQKSNQYLSSCENCTTELPTGILRVNTDATIDINKLPMNCSMIMLWESKERSLLAPDFLLNKYEQVETLTIYVDFLPAFEFLKLRISDGVLKQEHDKFIVPKRCVWRNTCENKGVDGAWRTSNCVSEMNEILKMNDKHLHAYKALKFFCQAIASSYKFSFYPVNQHHIKTTVINHDKTCSNTESKAGADCVMEILSELQQAYDNDQKTFQEDATEKRTCFLSVPSRYRGCGVPKFESRRIKNLIDSICGASQADSVQNFIKSIV